MSSSFGMWKNGFTRIRETDKRQRIHSKDHQAASALRFQVLVAVHT
jgi:hypothetical protein